MPTITVLGAGAMGSALTTPATDRGLETRLWGTWLDDELIAAVDSGQPHPRLDCRLSPSVRTYRSDALAEALAGTNIAVLAIASDGARDVAAAAAPLLPAGVPVLVTTKGFGRDPVTLLPDPLRELLGDRLVFAGGPCKANEVAAGRPTATVYAGARAGEIAAALATEHYRIECSDDVPGLEITAALKNVYAIALGICDGLADETPWHDLRAAVFTRAVGEMRVLAEAAGGRATTVYGLAGVGDLEVTGLSGRNKLYGVRIGGGEGPEAALAAMRAAGQTVEGVAALPLAVEFAARAGVSDVPLLQAIQEILDGRAHAPVALSEASLPS